MSLGEGYYGIVFQRMTVELLLFENDNVRMEWDVCTYSSFVVKSNGQICNNVLYHSGIVLETIA